jgi:hypothetical protein
VWQPQWQPFGGRASFHLFGCTIVGMVDVSSPNQKHQDLGAKDVKAGSLGQGALRIGSEYRRNPEPSPCTGCGNLALVTDRSRSRSMPGERHRADSELHR